ncbi:MAG: GrpB family protein [Anaerolineales bacterium]|nr:GrpB family protein [Anaerolineales bacterium]
MVNYQSLVAAFTAGVREDAALAAGARLGLRHEVNLLVEYDPCWPLAFALEEQRLRAVLDGRIVAIEHHGSTAVPGLCAKPIIDILIGVEQQAGWLHCKAPLAALGYAYAEHAGVPDHFIFGRGRHAGNARTWCTWSNTGAPPGRPALPSATPCAPIPPWQTNTPPSNSASHKAPTHRAHYTSLKAPFIMATLAAITDHNAGSEIHQSSMPHFIDN